MKFKEGDIVNLIATDQQLRNIAIAYQTVIDIKKRTKVEVLMTETTLMYGGLACDIKIGIHYKEFGENRLFCPYVPNFYLVPLIEKTKKIGAQNV